MADQVDRLKAVLGFDPTKQSITNNVLLRAVAELQKKQEAEAEVAATKLLEEAINLQREWKKKKAEFLKTEEKFEKSFGKLMRQIEAISSGGPQAEVCEEAESEKAEKPA